MAFRERIVPNLRGAPREFEPVARERRDTTPNLNDEQKMQALLYSREHRISLSQAIQQLSFDE